MSKPKKTKPTAGPNKVTRLEFSATHYNAEQLSSDMHYVSVANQILPVIHKVFSAQPGFTQATSKRIAITLACYVEDLVSGTGIWAAFISLYKKKYRNSFPFYNIKEKDAITPYDDEVPSFHAVLFLLWYVANDVNPDTVLNPNNPALRMLAMALMPDLAKAYMDAPDTQGRPILLPEKEIGVPLFYQIRNMCAWLCDRCYLTRINDIDKVANDFEEFIDHLFQSTGQDDPSRQVYAFNSFIPMNALIGPLAIPAYEWLAEIIGLYPEPEEMQFLPILSAIKSRPYQYYRYVSVGEKDLILKDVNGETLVLSAESMPDGKFSTEVVAGRSALLSLVLVDGVWLMNGIGLQGLQEEIYDEFCEINRTKTKEQKETYKFLLKNFGKQRIGICGSYEEYMKLAYGTDDPKIGGDPRLIANIREAGNLIYFLNTNGTVSMLPGWAHCIKLKDNPYYDSEEAAQCGISLILDHSLSSPEMRDYIIKNKLIPDAALSSVISPEAGRELFQKNIRFLNDFADRDTMPVYLDI